MKLKIVLTTLVFILMCGVFYHVNTMQNDPMQVIALIKKNINPRMVLLWTTQEILTSVG